MRNNHKNGKHAKNMRVKKSLFGLLLVVCCFVSTICFVLAGSTPTITVSSIDSASRGDEITLSVKLSNDKEYNGLKFAIEYDSDALEYVSSSLTKTSGDKTYDLSTVQVKDASKVYWVLGFADSSADTDNDLGTITFKVKDTASGSYDVSVNEIEMILTDYTTYEVTEIETQSVNGSVFVDVPVESSSLEKDSLEINVGETDTIKVNYSPVDTTDSKEFTYESADESIAKVDTDGKVTAVKAGSTTIKVTAFGSEYTVNVKVVSHINSISLNKETLDLSRDDDTKKTETLVATINPSDTTDDKTITWESSKPEVATVDSNGKITAVAGGTTTITAKTVNGKVATCVVNVVVPITGATINKESVTIEKGNSENLNVTITPSDTTEDATVTWSSSKPEVATVDSNGKVTAVAGGTTTITAKVGSYTLTSNVTVKVSISSFGLNKNSMELLPTQESVLVGTINPEDTTEDTTITWESSDTSVVTVDNTGKVNAIKAGTAVITAKVGEHSATCNVKVLVPIDSVVVSKSELNLNKGESDTLTVTILPDNAEESKNITWKSSDTKVATVDTNGKVTAVAGGTAIITGTLENGKKVETTVKVSVPISEVTLNKETLKLVKGATETLSVTVNPEDTTEDTTVTWESSDTSVVIVDSNGKVTANKAGTVTVTAKVGTFTKVCTVEVIVPIESVEITGSDFTLDRGKSIDLEAIVNPDDTTEDTTITWTSSDDSIATVDANGTVTGVKAGTVTITAKAGEKSDTVKVVVVVPITSFTTESEKVEVVKGRSVTINTEINPEDTTEKTTITWKSSDTSVASVDKDGVVTGVKAGTVTITGTIENGMKVECEVTVTIIPVTSINVSQEEVELLKGESKQISVVVNPTDTTEKEEIIWESSDEEIATVDSNGVIKGLKEGTVTITAKMGSFESECEVTVEEIPLESIEVVNTKDTIEIGEVIKLNVGTNPSTTTDDVVLTYESSDESVVKVDEDGNITGVGVGTVTITVKASDDIETTFDITVKSITSPKTGITSITTYIVITIISLIGIALVLKKKHSL